MKRQDLRGENNLPRGIQLIPREQVCLPPKAPALSMDYCPRWQRPGLEGQGRYGKLDISAKEQLSKDLAQK